MIRPPRKSWRIGALALLTSCSLLLASPLLGQAANSPPAPNTVPPPPLSEDNKNPDKNPDLGTYSLVTTDLEPSPKTHLLDPPIAIPIDGGTERHPGDFSGHKTVPPQYVIEDFATPRSECVSTDPKLHGCDALDRTDLTILDPTTIAYRFVSRGAPVILSINLQVHDIVPVAHGSPEIQWHAGDVIFVALPKATPTYQFSSETLVGTWNNQAVVFEIGKDLPGSAKEALDDLGTKQDLGDHILYSFRVKNPTAKNPAAKPPAAKNSGG